MRVEIRQRPSYAMAVVDLEPEETIVAEGGAMVSKDTHVELQTSARGGAKTGVMGGLMSGLKRMVAGESFFINRFTARGGAGHLTLAPTFPGDVVVEELGGASALILQSSAFLASADSVSVDASWGGAKSFFGGEGLVMLKATGRGPILFNAFGGVREVSVDGAFTVDTGHIVAFEDSLSFRVGRFGGGWRAFFFGGEGLVCHFEGRGKLWIQTRNPHTFGSLLGAKLPPSA